jgi:hypothetical protein
MILSVLVKTKEKQTMSATISVEKDDLNWKENIKFCKSDAIETITFIEK